MQVKSTLTVLMLYIFTNLSITADAQPVNIQDSLGLVDLYNSTNGPGWLKHDNWLNGPVRKWYGITVNETKVTRIDLSDNLLSGPITPELGKITNLHDLSLKGNKLTGTIPSQLGNLKSLVSLNLSYNELTGVIPAQLGNLEILDELLLHVNQLSGTIIPEIAKLTTLDSLDLSFNKLSGNIPPSLKNLITLSKLDLGSNDLTGTIPPELGNMLNLTILNLSYNELSGSIPPELGKLNDIIALYLYDNKLSGNIPPELGNLISLGRMNLSGNSLSGTIPPELADLPEECQLNLASNFFTFDGMELMEERFTYFQYGSQASIPIHQNYNRLSVSAGGTLSNNSYKWFKIGSSGNTNINADSVFYPSSNGKYYAKISNIICTELTLKTDTFTYEYVFPVTLINLTAQQQGGMVTIGWTSVTEINVDHYEIQRSADAQDFSGIGNVTAKGNGTESIHYAFNDIKPVQGNNYYRLKAIDKDGVVTFSNIALVDLHSAITKVYPNPAKDILNVQCNGSISFSFINQAGKTVYATTINNSGIINVSGLSGGMYYLKNNSTGEVQKVLVGQ